MRTLRRLWDDDSGQDMIEYALVAALVSVLAISLVQSVGTNYQVAWTRVTTALAAS